jgi:hypothetical protein
MQRSMFEIWLQGRGACNANFRLVFFNLLSFASDTVLRYSRSRSARASSL